MDTESLVLPVKAFTPWTPAHTCNVIKCPAFSDTPNPVNIMLDIITVYFVPSAQPTCY